MRGCEIHSFPLLVLLAVSQFAVPMRSLHDENTNAVTPTRSTPPATARAADEPARADASPPRAAIERERSAALLLLLETAAERWRMR